MKKTKYIFITGGVLSGLGKGVSAASLGNVLKAKGFKVFIQKLDPYYNTDPGIMSPYQHGEVYITYDGSETDLDLGHYERFVCQKFSKEANYTQGKILFEILNDERIGKYKGKTVQVVPHVTNKIIEKIQLAGTRSKADFVIIEIGGTIGDIESQPFIYAVAQIIRNKNIKTFSIHTTYIPFLNTSQEFKSKPTQQSIAILHSYGFFSNMILLRSNQKINKNIISKIADKFMIEQELIIPVPDIENIYKIPEYFEKQKVADKILEHFHIKKRETDLKEWKKFTNLIDKKKKHKINIAMVGKYVNFPEAYKSIVEAINISCLKKSCQVKFSWIQSEHIDKTNISKQLKNLDGVIILPGFGKRGFEGKVATAQYTRKHNIPTLGICYGFQAMVVAQARQKGISDATSSEVTNKGTFIVDIIPGKNNNLGGTMRLGESQTIHKKNSQISKIYQKDYSIERHRHRYEINAQYISQIEDENFVFSGYSLKNNLAEVIEMPNKKFYIGLQAHPEFNATPTCPHPLFDSFIQAMIK